MSPVYSQPDPDSISPVVAAPSSLPLRESVLLLLARAFRFPRVHHVASAWLSVRIPRGDLRNGGDFRPLFCASGFSRRDFGVPSSFTRGARRLQSVCPDFIAISLYMTGGSHLPSSSPPSSSASSSSSSASSASSASSFLLFFFFFFFFLILIPILILLHLLHHHHHHHLLLLPLLLPLLPLLLLPLRWILAMAEARATAHRRNRKSHRSTLSAGLGARNRPPFICVVDLVGRLVAGFYCRLSPRRLGSTGPRFASPAVRS